MRPISPQLGLGLMSPSRASFLSGHFRFLPSVCPCWTDEASVKPTQSLEKVMVGDILLQTWSGTFCKYPRFSPKIKSKKETSRTLSVEMVNNCWRWLHGCHCSRTFPWYLQGARPLTSPLLCFALTHDLICRPHSSLAFQALPEQITAPGWSVQNWALKTNLS